MTDQSTNRLIRGGSSRNYGGCIEVDGHTVPTEINEYAAWLNDREHRAGVWRVTLVDGRKGLEWKPQIGTDEWLRERGMIPKIGRAA